jgi:hypothetical protein
VWLSHFSTQTWCFTGYRIPAVRPPEWVRLTNLIDSATAPALSPDGRCSRSFAVPIRLFPRGRFISSCFLRERRYSLPHAETMKMSPVFSPDGSQIAYTVPGHWDTWIVPT